MQMAPQQLSGGPKYSSSTLIGNWSEQVSLERAKLDDFKHRTASGSSNLSKLQNKISKCTQKVENHNFILIIDFINTIRIRSLNLIQKMD